MIGKNVLELDRIDSTNAHAGRLLLQNPPEDGDVIWAREQSAGRGQHDHAWESEAGRNLTFTLILRPSFLAPDHQFLLNKALALGVVDFIGLMLKPVNDTEYGIRDTGYGIPHPVVSIKWPNDIYVGDRKAGGILIENKIMGSTLETSLAGIGININQEHFSPEIPNPVSLIHFLHRETTLEEALHLVCKYLDIRYGKLKNTDPAALSIEFDQHLFGYGKWRKFMFKGDPLDGKIKGVNNPGQLMVETRSGEILSFNHGEIGFVI